MFKKIRQKIESERSSKKIFWRILVLSKDFLWRIYGVYLKIAAGGIHYIYYNIFYFISFKVLKRGGKLPDFLIIGAQKGGTTYLWKMLKKHPDIEMSPLFFEIKNGRENTKEIHFFNNEKRWKKGIFWYKSLFNNNGKIQGEATPNYISAIDHHERMFKIVPNAKLILLMRNPVTRAYSAFNHMKDIGATWGKIYDLNKSFEENVDSEIKTNFDYGTMIKTGFYIDQIENLLKYYLRNQLLIIITEQMKKNPEKIYRQACEFLGVKNVKIDLNEKVHVREYNKIMGKETEQKLYGIFEPYNQRLYKFLGYKIKEWEDEKSKSLNNNSGA